MYGGFETIYINTSEPENEATSTTRTVYVMGSTCVRM
jgi:hypothetical protein